jgi:hypothetical protein
LHELDAHTYAPHDLGTSLHAPAPLHVLTCVSVPALQVAAPHAVVPPGNLQAVRSTPLHVCAQLADPPPVHAERPPTGAPVAGEQVPTFVARLQASHWPVHATSQQTPSTQNPEPHSLAPPQAVPLVLRHSPGLAGVLHELPAPQVETPQHTPSVQKRPDEHSTELAHVVPRPDVALHTLPLQ